MKAEESRWENGHPAAAPIQYPVHMWHSLFAISRDIEDDDGDVEWMDGGWMDDGERAC